MYKSCLEASTIGAGARGSGDAEDRGPAEEDLGRDGAHRNAAGEREAPPQLLPADRAAGHEYGIIRKNISIYGLKSHPRTIKIIPIFTFFVGDC